MPTQEKYQLPITKPWVYHSLFWLAYYIFAALISLSINQIYDTRFYWELLSMLPPDMLLVYANLYLLIPVFLLKRKFSVYVLSLLFCLSLESCLNIFLHQLYAQAGSAVYAVAGKFNSRNFASQLLNGIYLLGLTTALKFIKDWMAQRQQLQEKERQQVATELNFLKSQIHPHFFFNTLNNLYSLTLQKSDLAPEVVLKLSALMSYMLYDSAAPLVPLEKELENLDSYLALERLRFGNRLSLSFEKEGVSPAAHPGEAGQAASINIPPLLLLTFVENSFKHGMNQTIGEGAISISLVVQPDGFLFQVDNPIGSDAAAPEKNGIGLANVIRRLDLLYGSRYQLDLSVTDNRFHVTLKLPLP